MRKFLLMNFLLVITLFHTALAQEKKISGRVIDAASNLGLPGVTVLVKGTTSGTSTDVDGNYSINGPTTGTLVFSFIGYTTVERPIGDNPVINVIISPDTKQLGEVVVTALGYQREKETLPYSVGVVSSENLTLAKSNDVSASLAGKVAGVQLQGSPSASFDNANIVIRGQNSLGTSTELNNPIYVVDGTITDQNSVIMDNVENISILKGAAATALYGNRAANGVVLITSKKGKRGAPSVEFNLSAAYENVSLLPKYQNQYAGGYSSTYKKNDLGEGYLDDEGFYIFRYDPEIHPADWAGFEGQRILEYGADESWGPKINGQLYRPYYSWYPGPDFGKLEPLTSQPNNVKDFYQTGVNLNNSVAVSGGADNFTYRATYANQNRSLIIPNAKRDQHQIGINTVFDISKKLSISTDFTYTYNNLKGRPQEDYRNDGLNVPQNFNQWFQRQLDVERLKNYRNSDGTFNSWNIGDPNTNGDPSFYLAPQYWDSPYFVVENNYGTSKTNRLVGNLGLNYKINDNLSWQSFARMSYRNADGDFRIATGGLNTDSYSINQTIEKEMNYETNLNYKRIFGDFSIDALAGGNIRRNTYDDLAQATAGGLTFPNYFDIGNGSIARPTSTRTYRNKIVNSLYGRASLGYKSFLFLDASLRNDWSSALPVNNNSYLYPSFGGSFVVSELVNSDAFSRILSQAKLRGSWAQVGSDLGFNQVNTVIDNFSIYGTTPSASIGNEFRTGNIQPALTTSWEVGADFRFFNRIGFEVTYYKDDNKNQIISLDVDPATGFNNYQINAGKIQRKGIELSLSGSPVQRENGFNWDIVANYGRNRSTIVELASGLSNYLVGTDWNDTRLEHRVGKEWGMLVGRKWRRNEQGQVLVASNGIPLYDINQERGSVQADFTGGLVNNLSYKGVSLSFSVDFRKGGLFYSSTKQFGLGTGLHEETVGLNDQGHDWRDYVAAGGGIKVDGVLQDGTPNTTYVEARRYFYGGLQRDAINQFVIDGSYLKLREVRLGYELPKSLLGSSLIKGVNIGIIVNNAWLIASPGKKWGIDPSELEDYWTEGGQLPQTRTTGFNLRVRL